MHAKAGRSRPPTTLKTKSPVCWWTHDPDKFVREEVEGGCSRGSTAIFKTICNKRLDCDHARNIAHSDSRRCHTDVKSLSRDCQQHGDCFSTGSFGFPQLLIGPTRQAQCREEKKSDALVLRCNDYHFQGRSKEHRGRDSRGLSKSAGMGVDGPRVNRVWTRTLPDV